MTIRIKGLEIKTRKKIPYVEGVTVGQVLEKAKMTLPAGGTVTVNDVKAALDALVPDGALVVMIPPVENGG